MSPFSVMEIVEGLRNCGNSKSPLPDGFNFFFYKRAWPMIKDDIL